MSRPSTPQDDLEALMQSLQENTGIKAEDTLNQPKPPSPQPASINPQRSASRQERASKAAAAAQKASRTTAERAEAEKAEREEKFAKEGEAIVSEEKMREGLANALNAEGFGMDRPPSSNMPDASPVGTRPGSAVSQLSDASISEAESRSPTPLQDSVATPRLSEDEYLTRIIEGRGVEQSTKALQEGELAGKQELMRLSVLRGDAKSVQTLLSVLPKEESKGLMEADYFGKNIMEVARDAMATNLESQVEVRGDTVQGIQSVAATLAANGAPCTIKPVQLDPSLDTQTFINRASKGKEATQMVRDAALAGLATSSRSIADLIQLKNDGANPDAALQIAKQNNNDPKVVGRLTNPAIGAKLEVVDARPQSPTAPLAPIRGNISAPKSAPVTPPPEASSQGAYTGNKVVSAGRADLMMQGFVKRQGNAGVSAAKSVAPMAAGKGQGQGKPSGRSY